MVRDRLKVNGTIYKVKHRKRVFYDGELVMGICLSGGRQEIRVTTAGPFEQFDTEWHEALHAIVYEYRIVLTHDQLTKLAGALVQVLIESPWLGQPRGQE